VLNANENKYYAIDQNNGRLTINDSEGFIKILSADLNSQNSKEESPIEYYNLLKQLGLKQLNKVASTDIDKGDFEYIINYAIAKTVRDFDINEGANLTSFFWNKVKGEVSAYRSKRDIMQKKVVKIIKESEDMDYGYEKDNSSKSSDTMSNNLIALENETEEDKLMNENLYFRRIKAVKMAFSTLPRDLQIVLNQIANGVSIKGIAKALGEEEINISKKRNQGLSLILQKILRSKHLDEEEKNDLIIFHNIKQETN